MGTLILGTSPRHGVVASKRCFDVKAFYQALALVVEVEKISWKQLSEETGVIASTISRMSKGMPPDGGSLAILSAWANINAGDFIVRSENSQSSDASIAISRILKSDPNLDPQAAECLEKVISLLYSSFRLKKRGE